MDKLTVVLDRNNMTVTMDGKAMRIDAPGISMQRVPLGMIGQVMVYGNPSVDCNVWRSLAERGIAAVLLPARGTGPPAWLGSGLSTSVMVRIRQHRAYTDEQIRRKAVVWLLQGKVRSVLQLLNAVGTSQNQWMGEFVSRTALPMKKLNKNLKKSTVFFTNCLQQISSKKSVDTLRGIEGAAAKEWFSFMGKILPKPWYFKGRNRRPPKDPVNALLSLSYTMLMAEIRREVQARGVDPCLGFLHTPYPGRESLILDIAEPLRPGVDAFVLSLLDETVTPNDFSMSKAEGCRLSKQGRAYYYTAWEEWKRNWPFAIYSPQKSDDNGDPQEYKTLKFTTRKLLEGFVELWENQGTLR